MNTIDSVRLNPRGFIIFSALFIGCIVFASFYGGVLPFVLLPGIILIIPVSFAYIFINYHFLSVYQELDVHRLVKGEMHNLTIAFENTGILPIHDMELVLYLDRCDFEGIADKDRISLEGRSKKKIMAKTVCIYAGVYNIGIKGVRFYDAFKIFSITFNIPSSFRTIVSPKITDLANSYLDIENILNSLGAKSILRYEEIPGNDMRSYYPGDAVASINWKVSAKLDKLTVRIPDRLDTRTVTLFLEASNIEERFRDIEYIKRRDHFLEFAVSAAFCFAGRGIPVRLVYPAGKITEKTIDTYEGFLDFYNDVSSGISYRSSDERERMHKLTQERRNIPDGNETRVFILEEASGSDDFCVIAG